MLRRRDVFALFRYLFALPNEYVRLVVRFDLKTCGALLRSRFKTRGEGVNYLAVHFLREKFSR